MSERFGDFGSVIEREQLARWSGPLIWLLVLISGVWMVWSNAVDPREWNPMRRKAPPTPLERIGRMRVAFASGRWQEALDDSRALRDTLADDPERMRVESASLLRLGRAGEAVDILRRLSDRDVNDLGIRLALALALAQAGSVDEARAVLERVRRHPLATSELQDQAMGMLAGLDALEPAGDPVMSTPDGESRQNSMLDELGPEFGSKQPNSNGQFPSASPGGDAGTTGAGGAPRSGPDHPNPRGDTDPGPSESSR